MKRICLLALIASLTACTTTLPHFTKAQQSQSKALSVLANYSGNILAAAAVPLQYYCKHQQWPDPNTIDTTQPLLSNLPGLWYQRVSKHYYQANFTLINQIPNAPATPTNWEVLIPTIHPAKTQKVHLQVSNPSHHIKLLDVLDFQCKQNEPAHAATKTSPTKPH